MVSTRAFSPVGYHWQNQWGYRARFSPSPRLLDPFPVLSTGPVKNLFTRYKFVFYWIIELNYLNRVYFLISFQLPVARIRELEKGANSKMNRKITPRRKMVGGALKTNRWENATSLPEFSRNSYRSTCVQGTIMWTKHFYGKVLREDLPFFSHSSYL